AEPPGPGNGVAADEVEVRGRMPGHVELVRHGPPERSGAARGDRPFPGGVVIGEAVLGQIAPQAGTGTPARTGFPPRSRMAARGAEVTAHVTIGPVLRLSQNRLPKGEAGRSSESHRSSWAHEALRTASFLRGFCGSLISPKSIPPIFGRDSCL